MSALEPDMPQAGQPPLLTQSGLQFSLLRRPPFAGNRRVGI